MQQLVDQFSIDRVGKSGSKFDPEKAKWFNHQYLVGKTNDELAGLYSKILAENGIEAERDFVIKVIGLVKERANFVSDFWDQSKFFFIAPTEYDPKVVKKRWKESTPAMMGKLKEVVVKVDDFKADNIKQEIVSFIEANEIGMGAVMNAFRLVLVGGGFGPDLMQIAELLGKEEVLRRIESGIQNIKR
jgi:glutamyl-tRNA synthetase